MDVISARQQEIESRLQQVMETAPIASEAGVSYAENIRGVYIEGPPALCPETGKMVSTRFFSYIGIPKGEGPFPSIVLVHGGGGAAFGQWVKLFCDQGFIAIAPDMFAQMPNPDMPGHIMPDPQGRPGMDDLQSFTGPVEGQWAYHAVSRIILAGNYLRTLPLADPSRIFLNGVSWGGYLSSLVMGYDNRFAGICPVYGCGYLPESATYFEPILNRSGLLDGTPVRAADFWEPSLRFHRVTTPTLWISGDGDHSFSANCVSKSAQATNGNIALLHNYEHNHYFGIGDGLIPPPILRFFQHLAFGCPPLLQAETPAGRNFSFAVHLPADARLINVQGYALDRWFDCDKTAPGSPVFQNFLPFPVTLQGTLVSGSAPAESPGYYVAFEWQAPTDPRPIYTSTRLVDLRE